MAAQRSRLATPTPVALASSRLRSTANVLADLSTALSVEWDVMDSAGRSALVGRIQELALQVGRLAEPTVGPSPEVTDPEALRSPWFEGLSRLTPREHEVLRILAFGASTGSIGELLGISQGTVRSHVKSLLTKLGVHSRVEAISVFLRSDIRRQLSA
jgi:DNA-binding CsgD family transcriptional regulator